MRHEPFVKDGITTTTTPITITTAWWHGGGEGADKLDSSNQPRHTQRQEKRGPSTLMSMLWGKSKQLSCIIFE